MLKTRPHRKHVFLLTVPRCGSHLLHRILSTQPDCDLSSYHFFSAWLGTRFENHYSKVGPLDTLPGEQRKELDKRFQKKYEELQSALQASETAVEHVLFLINPLNIFTTRYPEDTGSPFEVSYPPASDVNTSNVEKPQRTSPCIVPDNFLLSIEPVFQIRHPALMFPSAARATRDSMKPGKDPDGPFDDHLQSLMWSRLLYDWYVKNGINPIVIDADDVMCDDRSTVQRLCDATGLDANHLLYEWKPKTDETGFQARFLSTLNASTGVVQGLTSEGIDIKAEEEKWKAEFGEEWGDIIARRVRTAIPDYEWLCARKL
ncbi:hypothetical protein FH972_021360 [Carpinus fangiana]|uniref:Sulfotransferase n=1 Tax=Carpinus fangiana TaxID=176857 RepID=A0A5N6KPI0_9ROSI|nr:hypothetical protein FH972_021360 [Carpinus fangiana]